MTEHTPTPWHTDQVELFDTFNQVLGLIRTTANAAFIVRAVNCHEELVAALVAVEWKGPTGSGRRLGSCSMCYGNQADGHAPDCQLAAALAKAKEVK